MFYLNLISFMVLVFAASCGETETKFTSAKTGSVPADEALNAESEAEGSEERKNGIESAAEEDQVINAETLAAKCNNTTQLTYTQAISFPELPVGQTCNWGNGGNLSALNGFLRARDEQSQTLNIPNGALFCGISLSFNPSGQSMYYDDEIFLMFNDIIFAASQSYSNLLETRDGFMRYDWSRLVGKNYLSSYPQYCVGQNCTIPVTQTQGTMSMQITDEVARNLALALGVGEGGEVGSGSFQFKFATLGDNDSGDCRHSRFDFNVTVKYVMK